MVCLDVSVLFGAWAAPLWVEGNGAVLGWRLRAQNRPKSSLVRGLPPVNETDTMSNSAMLYEIPVPMVP